MNPFTTIPRAITVLLAAHNYNRNIPEIEKLRAAGDIEGEKECIRLGQKKFIETIAPKINLTFDVTGEENIPETNGFMVYSNHQSLADIFALIYLFRDRCQMGYVAKEEWRKYKIIANAILSVTTNKFLILLLMNIIMLIFGTMMDMSCNILLLTPILLPIAQQIGVDPVQFGCIMILNLGIGLVTPPVGSTLFIGSAISKVPIERLGKTLIPFFIVMLIVLGIVTYWPAFTMTLPNIIMPLRAG